MSEKMDIFWIHEMNPVETALDGSTINNDMSIIEYKIGKDRISYELIGKISQERNILDS